ncbi:MAG TPA: ABC transporter ATP-binding protein [Dehalococcoidia bacterium]|nr:ABC transporter ATP-binding protein [Dehalococcoidia bacterium]
MSVLLSIKDLTVRFYTYDGIVTALNNISLNIGDGETYGIVGETGCGKTMTALSILRLIPPPGKIDNGTIEFNYKNGQPVNLLKLPEREIRNIRGNKISMIFQEPNSALNPVYTIGDQISETILLHRRSDVLKRVMAGMDKPVKNQSVLNKIFSPMTRSTESYIYNTMSRNPRTRLPRLVQGIPVIRNLLWRTKLESTKMAIEMLKDVEIPDSERIARQYPHELSGGMKQRSVIAMSLACNPRLLIADEPTTALDVTIQAQILDLLRNLKKEHAASILYITHDLGVAAEICDRIGVMYCGSICEEASVDEIYANPLHPYTQALMAAVPKPGQEFKSVGGFLPSLIDAQDKCQFQPRCNRSRDICKEQSPAIKEVSPGHFVSCHLV